jgi:hemoglobin/transferrin/lactoferrin receptor protein
MTDLQVPLRLVGDRGRVLVGLAVFLLTAQVPLGAQPASQADRTIAGIVEDTSGGALAGATVVVTCGSLQRATTSDARGDFSLTNIPAARCGVQARSPLFTGRTLDVDLTTRRSSYVRLVLNVAGVASEVTVTPARGEQERTFDVPEAVGIATREEIASRPVQILPQALREETGILVQQTTTAQGSPFIRGFSAQRVVYVLDGVRFNTSTYRAGATQYLGWVNPSLVQRMEVIRGPSSAQYGSDALGGSMQVISERPSISPAGTHLTGAVDLFAGSADTSIGGDLSVQVRTPALALRGGASTRRLDDLRAGGGDDSRSSLTRYLGLPSETLYDRMPDTGFDQTGGYLAATVPAGEGAHVNGLYMHEVQTGVSRYDRIIGGDGLHQSRFEPQRLDFGYLTYQRAASGPLDAWSATLSLNRQQDDRLEQRRPTTTRDFEDGSVTAWGYQAQGTSLAASRHAITFGAEVYDEYVDSRRWSENPESGAVTFARPEIPDGTHYVSTGVYAQDTVDLGPVSLRGGLRYGFFSFRTREDAALGVDDEQVTASAMTFHSGVVWKLTDWLNATSVVSRGFRAANAFDLGAIGISGNGFEIAPTTAQSFGALVGSNDGTTATSTGASVESLAPESLYSFEGGLKLRAGRVSASLDVFDLELVDIIQRRTMIFPTSIVGEVIAGYEIVRQDAEGRAFIAEDPRPVQSRVNVDRARVVGVELDGQVRVAPGWLAGAWFSLANGHELGTDAYLRRMPPAMGGIRARWEPTDSSLWAEGVLVFARPQTRLASGDLSDARIGASRTSADIAAFFNGTAVDLGLVSGGLLLPTGETLAEVQNRVLGDQARAPLYTQTDGFVSIGLRGGWRVTPRLDLIVIGENLSDENYRWHGSGVDAPGINVQIRTRFRF